MFSRPFLTVLLSLGVVLGYGSAFASARWHARSCHSGWSQQRGWSDDRWHHRWEREAQAPSTTPAAVTAPAPAAPAAAGLPQVIIVMPQAVPQAAVPQVVVTPAAAPATN